MSQNRSLSGTAGRVTLCVMIAMSLVACGEEDAPEALPSESAPPPAPSTSPPPAPANNAPLITGQPPPNARAGEQYAFAPTAPDAEHSALTYPITGLPVWATFNAATGSLSGAPTDGHV